MLKFLKRSPPKPSPAVEGDGLDTGIDVKQLLARMNWLSAKKLHGLLQGDYRTLFRGTGLTLADLREYTPADDVRHIDWNVTARMQAPYVREYEADREISAWFIVDLSASVDFGSAGTTKRMVAAQAIATLGQLIQQRGNRLGAIIDVGHAYPHILPARNGQRHLLHVLRQAVTLKSDDLASTTDLSTLLWRAGRIIRQRCTVFILSDFLSVAGWEKALSALAQRHDVIAVRLIDPLERELPDMGMLTMRDPETGEQIFLDTSDAAFRRRFNAHAQAHEQQLIETLSSASVDCLELDTASDVQDGLVRFIQQRQALLRRPAAGMKHASVA